MNIPVKIIVGCEITYVSYNEGLLRGIVTYMSGDSVTVLHKTTHIKKIVQFTFGGVWVRNTQFDLYAIF